METIKKYYFRDMSVMLGRSMRHVSRSMDTIITVTIMPIALMLLFVYVLGGAIQSGTGKYVNYLLPGILLMAIANGIGYVSFRLFNDVQRGIFERFNSMPIARSAALASAALPLRSPSRWAPPGNRSRKRCMPGQSSEPPAMVWTRRPRWGP